MTKTTKNILVNDTTTAKDEIVLTILTAISLLVGILLVVFKPSIWFITSNDFVVVGVLLIMIAVMFIPCIAYRFITNKEIKEKRY